MTDTSDKAVQEALDCIEAVVKDYDFYSFGASHEPLIATLRARIERDRADVKRLRREMQRFAWDSAPTDPGQLQEWSFAWRDRFAALTARESGEE